MFYQLAVAVPAGFAVIIVGSAADYTVSVLLVRLVDVKIVLKAVEMIYLIADGKFINVVFYFAGSYVMDAPHKSGGYTDAFLNAQGLCRMFNGFSVFLPNGKHDIVFVVASRFTADKIRIHIGLDIYCRNNAFPIAVKQRKGDSRYAEGHGIHGDADAGDGKGRDKLIGKYGFPIMIHQSGDKGKQDKAKQKALDIGFEAFLLQGFGKIHINTSELKYCGDKGKNGSYNCFGYLGRGHTVYEGNEKIVSKRNGIHYSRKNEVEYCKYLGYGYHCGFYTFVFTVEGAHLLKCENGDNYAEPAVEEI